MASNLRYKDSLFTALFSDPETLRELYSAMEGIPVDPSVPVSINTLKDVLYMERYNDISFTIGNAFVVLIEHQSTVNPNMPLRFLFYIAKVYEKILEQEKPGSLYRGKLIKIPFPEFFVLYNGTSPYPDKITIKLSEAFKDTGGAGKGEGVLPKLDLIVKVYNINKGHNEDIAKKCETLRGYSTFIDKARENNKTMGREDSIKNAIDYCIEHNILSAFLIEHSSEVRNMLLTEWDSDAAKKVWQEEAREEGREEGREEKSFEMAKKALSEGLSLEIIQRLTGLNAETINSLSAGQN
jgi:hypothetical protein